MLSAWEPLTSTKPAGGAGPNSNALTKNVSF